jgi:hypothetical protein
MNNGRISTVGRRLVNINEWHMSSNSAKKDLVLFPYRLTYVQGLHIQYVPGLSLQEKKKIDF